MLKEIIEKGYFSFEQHFDDWQEAIRAGIVRCWKREL